jgi:hypothetical protein
MSERATREWRTPTIATWVNDPAELFVVVAEVEGARSDADVSPASRRAVITSAITCGAPMCGGGR